MSKKKYQIFISSTYKDLVEAREKVIETVLRMCHFPIGMEMFSADDDDQWLVIKDTIDQSDYYVVIIGHRYGSETSAGISYTEKEYDYAKLKGLPILAFIQDRNVSTKPDERESEVGKIEKLNRFISKAERNKLRDTWETIDELGGKVAIALGKMFDKKPSVGWIRSDMTASGSTQPISLHKKEFTINLTSVFDNAFIQAVLCKVLRDEYNKFLDVMIRKNNPIYSEEEQLYTIVGGVPGLVSIANGIFQFSTDGYVYISFTMGNDIKYYTNDDRYSTQIPEYKEMRKWLNSKRFEQMIYFCSVSKNKLKPVSGEYEFQRNRISKSIMKVIVKEQEITFKGKANFGGNVGLVEGTAILVGGYLASYEDSKGNKLKFTFFDDKIRIDEQGCFGGSGVTFSGEYDKLS